MSQSNVTNPDQISFILPSGPFTLKFPPSNSSSLTNQNRNDDPQGNEGRPTNYLTNVIPPSSTLTTGLHWHETHTEYFQVSKGYVFITVGAESRIIGPSNLTNKSGDESSNKGIVEVKPFTLHQFQRADTPDARKWIASAGANTKLSLPNENKWEEENVEVIEWNDPVDPGKEVFFRNAMGFYCDEIQDIVVSSPSEESASFFSLKRFSAGKLFNLLAGGMKMIVLSHYMDNYNLIVGGTLGGGSKGKPNMFARTAVYGLAAFAGFIGWVFGWGYWWEKYTPEQHRRFAKMTLGRADKLKRDTSVGKGREKVT